MHATDFVELEEAYGAHNYHPLDVVIDRAEGVWVWDVEGRRYLDMLSAYSALNQGHRHPAIIQALLDQAGRVTLTSRAFRNDQLGLLYQELNALTGYDLALPMNTGAEAVETAIKLARKWGYEVKGIPRHEAEIIVASGNFHGRTVSIVSFSTEPQYRDDFGPFTPGFTVVPYGDAAALEAAITPHTCAASRPTPVPCCSSRSRAKPASWCRLQAISRPFARSPSSGRSCSWRMRSRPALAEPGGCSAAITRVSDRMS